MFEEIIKFSGGTVENGIVLKPGIKIIQKSEPTEFARQLFQQLHLSENDYEALAEFNNRLTYLNFSDQYEPDYLKNIIVKHGHLSGFSATNITFLLAGISIEASLEMIAHSEAVVSRLTTSKTKAMDVPLLVKHPNTPPEEFEKAAAYLKSFDAASPENREFRNRCHPGIKATVLTYTMNLKQFHRLFIGRMPKAGNEEEVRDICFEMCSQLNELYPLIIKAPAEYLGSHNSEKDNL